MEGDDAGAHRIRHVHRAGVRAQQDRAARAQGEEALEGVLADEVDHARVRGQGGEDGVGRRAFQRTRPAAQRDAPAPLQGPCGDGGIALGRPVPERMAGTGGDEERRRLAGELRDRPVVRFVGHGKAPFDAPLRDADRFAEPGEGIQHMVASRRDALADHEAVPLLRARDVVADPPFGADQRREQVGPQRELHLQQHVEAPSGQRVAEGGDAAPAGRLVEDQQFDAFEAAQHRGFGLAGDPRDRSARTVALDRPHEGHDMRRVAERGQTEQADRRSVGGHGGGAC